MKLRLSALWFLAFAFAILASWVNVAHAAPTDAILTWTPPTQNVDNSTLTDLAGYVISYSTDPTIPATNLQTVNVTNKALTTWTVSGLAPGKWYFTIRTVNSTGDNSARSQIASVTLVAPPPPPPTIPKPPTDLKVTTPNIPNTAYQFITNSAGQIVLLPIGTVPPDTPCDASQGVMRGSQMFYAVPKAAITYSGTARPLVAVVACGAG